MVCTPPQSKGTAVAAEGNDTVAQPCHRFNDDLATLTVDVDIGMVEERTLTNHGVAFGAPPKVVVVYHII